LAGLWAAIGEVRAGVWRRSSATTGTAEVVLDIDSSLHQVHSENKEQTAPNYKGGFGFHPIYCFADATGQALGMFVVAGQCRGEHDRRPRHRCRSSDRPAARRDRPRSP
jgi:hypothetical protein